MKSPEVKSLAGDLRFAIGELVRATRVVDQLAARFAGVLGYLDHDGPMTIGELAMRQRVRQQSMTATTGELFERGYVTREAHPSDGRKTVIHITDLGRETLNQERLRRAGSLADAIIHQLNDDEQRRLKDAVGLLARLARYSPQ